MARQTALEREILATGALHHGDFTAANGENGNLKVDLDSLLNDEQHQQLRARVVAKLADELSDFDPQIIIPMPEGANSLGLSLAKALGSRAVMMLWKDKQNGILAYADQHHRIAVCLAERIALVDDVYRTGSTFDNAIIHAELSNKQLIGGAVYDRSNPRTVQSSFPIHSVVKRFMPIYIEPES